MLTPQTIYGKETDSLSVQTPALALSPLTTVDATPRHAPS